MSGVVEAVYWLRREVIAADELTHIRTTRKAQLLMERKYMPLVANSPGLKEQQQQQFERADAKKVSGATSGTRWLSDEVQDVGLRIREEIETGARELLAVLGTAPRSIPRQEFECRNFAHTGVTPW